MPEPKGHPEAPQVRGVARRTLAIGVLITLLKTAIWAYTDSVAVMTDALESVVNIVAASFMLYSLWLSNRPADATHPYGHGKIEFLAVGFEGCLILVGGLLIAYHAIHRLIWPAQLDLALVGRGIWMLAGVGIISAALAAYVLYNGRKFDSPTLRADGKHLMTDVASTAAVLVGLVLVHYTGRQRLDPIVAIVVAAFILYTSWKLLWEAAAGLMDRMDEADHRAILNILDEEVQKGTIRGYHKVRHRHTGPFHWVDMHLQVDPSLNVAESHELASRIEHRIEVMLGEGNATAHVEPGAEGEGETDV